MSGERYEQAKRRPGAGLSLVGYRGTGKSTVGRLIAKQLGLRFADADQELEASLGRRISTIFSEDGEEAFREAEEAGDQAADQRVGNHPGHGRWGRASSVKSRALERAGDGGLVKSTWESAGREVER